MDANKFSKQEDSVLTTIVCLLGIIHSIMYIDTMKGSVFEEYYFIATIISLTCVIGLWRLKLWAFFTYLSVFITNQFFLNLINKWFLSQAIIPIVLLMFFIKIFKSKE